MDRDSFVYLFHKDNIHRASLFALTVPLADNGITATLALVHYIIYYVETTLHMIQSTSEIKHCTSHMKSKIPAFFSMFGAGMTEIDKGFLQSGDLTKALRLANNPSDPFYRIYQNDLFSSVKCRL